MANLIISGLGISNYRSFGPEMQYSGTLGTVNLLAGQNNAGKSNFLGFLQKVARRNIDLGPLDTPQGGLGEPCRYVQAFPLDETVEAACSQWHAVAAKLREFFNHPSFKREDSDPNLGWFEFDSATHLTPSQFDSALSSVGNLSGVAQFMTKRGVSGGLEQNRENAALIVRKVFKINPLPIETINAFRQIRIDTGEGDAGPNEGTGLLRRLQKLQNPAADTYHQDVEKFASINRFLQGILDDSSARLEVQHDASVLNVHHGGRMLPLSHLGTGIHQVVILAVAATVLEKTIVCIEEPEVHLHPILQRKFIQYLTRETTNQYIIATHSAHLLDFSRASIIHVSHNGFHTELTPALTPSSVSDVCSDLGYRPSDLLQTNAVIWVEGPSDRIYLKHWIEQRRTDLVEGLHYSIMFYGGGLLNHLTSLDEEVNDFIELRRLNRHIAILIDSDKDRQNKPINETKKRLQAEFDSPERPGFAWITDGYTIENYVPPEILRRAVETVHPGAETMSWMGEKWTNPLKLISKNPDKDGNKKPLNPDKNKIARIACSLWTEEPSGSLGRMISKSIDFIEQANAGVEKSL
ncbi:ATP-dependent endonuclease [Streptomyces flavochromogenes]|uniref:ATP-dependent endonuclease n=1 Tax=Streptomyces flavochromogenes TaxID=68199 RepID=A0ABW6XND5_9ACTN